LLKKNKLNFDINPYNRRLNEKEIFNIIKTYDGLIADLEPLNAKVLNNANNLKIISRVGIGINNIDLDFSKKKKILIKNTPDAPTAAVVDFTIGLIFNLIRNISKQNQDMKKGKWNREFGLSLKNLKVGILGFGRTGSLLANKLIQLGTQKIYYNDLIKKKTNKKIQFQPKSFIYKNSDILSVHLPETNQTKNILNNNVFKLFKKNMYLINTSRGEIIDENSLVKFLKKGYFSGVALDVFKVEPYKGILSKFDRCILTPHISSHTVECRNRMELEATQSVVNFFNSLK
jgi:D-3-phosphoglycerate dehydrogenase